MKRQRTDSDNPASSTSGKVRVAITEPFAENRYRKYRFQRESILLNAPESSGLYGLYSAVWIYVGEADNIRARLLEHLETDNPPTSNYQPFGFAFELVSPPDRSRRLKELLMELQPLAQSNSLSRQS